MLELCGVHRAKSFKLVLFTVPVRAALKVKAISSSVQVYWLEAVVAFHSVKHCKGSSGTTVNCKLM